MLPGLGDETDGYNTVLVRRVVLETVRGHSLAYAKTFVIALRAFLRFLATEGRCRPLLHRAVPTIPQWTLASLPRHLDADQIQRVIDACDLDKPKGVRDRAVILLLARLGLRAGDIVSMRLGDIRRLLEAASRLGPRSSGRAETHVTLFALLSSTGLRISEALALQLDDVTLDGLRVRNTKFRKSRLVPLHPTARAGLEHYLTTRVNRGATDSSLFLSLWEKRLSYSRVNEIFLRLMRSIGLRGEPGTPGPRMHDLRHTFAVRALEAAEGDGEDIARHILALSTYLGHAHPSDTYWYLQATPKLMAGISEAAERFFTGAGT